MAMGLSRMQHFIAHCLGGIFEMSRYPFGMSGMYVCKRVNIIQNTFLYLQPRNHNKNYSSYEPS
jgi:hypothetical protein